MSRVDGIEIWQVDAFADEPFSGNPAAVCVLERFPSDEWMQRVAAEMNLSETAFVVPLEDRNHFQLRWFTPIVEVDLCGHATLAAAHVLLQCDRATATESIRFETKSGQLDCESNDGLITLNFPADPALSHCDKSIGELLSVALRIQQPIEVFQCNFDLLVLVKDPANVYSIDPDFYKLAAVETRGVIVSSISDREGIDFISRFFAPRCGIDEDPVTGSAHCCLAPYWSAKLGNPSLVGFQASPRGGTVQCRVVKNRVELTGRAITVLRGRLLVQPT